MSEKNIPQDVYTRIESEALAWSENQHGHDDVNTDYLNGALREAAIAQENITSLQTDYDHLKTKYDNILATENGHESKTENVWQSGYAAGHDTGYERGKREVKGPGWIKASERLPAKDGYYCFKANGGYMGAYLRIASNGSRWFCDSAGGTIRNWKQCEWLDESPAEQPVISQDAHEKEVIMQAFDKVRQIFEGREWIMEGRGSYPYNDDRYKEEVRYMYDEFDKVFNDTWANIKSKSVEYREKIIAEYLHGDHPATPDILKRIGYQPIPEQPVREVDDKVSVLEEEIKRRNRLLENNMKLGMRLNMPGISEQDQEATWQDYKRRNNL